MTESQTNHPSVLTRPELHDDEKLIVREFGHVKVINYHEQPVSSVAIIDGESWRVVGTGEGSDGQPLAVVESPSTHDLVPVRLDHLQANERVIPDVTSAGMSKLAAEHSVEIQPSEKRTTIKIIDGAQSLGNDQL